MRHSSRGLAMAAVLLLFGTSAVSAQHPQTRKGFWIGFGLGYGSYGISCDGCSGLGRESSYTGHLRMGGTLSPHLLLGGEIDGWSKSESGSTLSAGNVTLNASYYPQPAGGFFLNGGIGLSRVEASGGGSSSGETGPGVTVGAGYDLRVGTNVSVTPLASWVWGHPTDGLSHNFYQFGVGVTFH